MDVVCAVINDKASKIYAHYSERILHSMFKAIKKMLKEASTLPNKSIVYLNICIRVLDLNFKIGYYLDADDDTNQHEVIVVHGQ